jgi:hypothetical protein
MKRVLLVATLLFLASTASAYESIKYLFTGAATKLSAVALTASAATRTWGYSSSANDGFGLIFAQVTYTRGGGSSVTAISMSCVGDIDGGTTDATFQSCSTVSGLCTSTDQTWTKTVSATGSWIWRVDAQGASNVRCVVGSTGTPNGDTITVKTKITAF